jgi:phytoene dehydrogenase-like protein
MGVWVREQLESDTLRRFFGRLVPKEAPALFALMVLGYLERGYLSRPRGGTAAFRDALIASYERLGGESLLHATVEEILVEDGRARGVRLGDGTMIGADAVICTASAPETVLRLLGGQFGADETRDRMKHWKLFDPIVLVSFGVAAPLSGVPAMIVVDGMPSLDVGGRQNEHLYLRVCNDDPSLAPPGHAVVQAMLQTDYAWWATRGTSYEAAKDQVAKAALGRIEHIIPEIGRRVRMSDAATPLTYWQSTRSWRGAYEGWIPVGESPFGHVKKTLPGLERFCMAGQWVEPGGGVPMAIMSGRQAVQLLCVDRALPFVSDPSKSGGAQHA